MSSRTTKFASSLLPALILSALWLTPCTSASQTTATSRPSASALIRRPVAQLSPLDTEKRCFTVRQMLRLDDSLRTLPLVREEAAGWHRLQDSALVERDHYQAEAVAWHGSMLKKDDALRSATYQRDELGRRLGKSRRTSIALAVALALVTILTATH